MLASRNIEESSDLGVNKGEVDFCRGLMKIDDKVPKETATFPVTKELEFLHFHRFVLSFPQLWENKSPNNPSRPPNILENGLTPFIQYW